MKKRPTYFTQLNSLAIVGTFFSLWLAVFFDDDVENMLAYFLILTFGMLHGANDIKLIQYSRHTAQSTFPFLKVLASYILVVLFGLALFYFLPTLAFIFFLVVSGYHFGEQHWVSKLKPSSIWASLFFCSYGLFVLFLLFYQHVDTVSEVILKLTNVNTQSIHFYYMVLLTGISSLFLFVVLKIRKELSAHIIKELFFLAIFFVVFNTASLLWSFAIYFILWHSLPSIADQITFLYGKPNKHSIIKYLKSSLLYWILAALSSAMLLYIFRDDMELALSFFIAFLAAITFPHVFVISRLNKN
ncbi:Brp/Blh family beta-carotene 15,15'-dioxygenase [Costertonia aggregata]|uniref:Probable beta-carotene 15,15'-dioxygenase n=1 Tax=Costertonia aggregata TaxID=343403 RepID=A0A7H9ARN7_9FLAO|nr:Brp/Blh family beta-carotene 15,15'-dioxygenase [Costertonia aggregata]QLG46123.1 Brp/Blh family beta-carotene 15,15'-dioxygenase [Costertonia aggregata]